jgi:hypothetical protein
MAFVQDKYRVSYEVEEIRGKCPVYKIGDKAVFDSIGFTEQVNLDQSDAVCMRLVDNMWIHQLYQHASEEVIDYMGRGAGECRCACAMPGEPYTPCGYVIFRTRRERID